MTLPSSRRIPLTGARRGVVLARLACGVGLLFAAVSVYWGLGGRWLLDTVGGDLAARPRSGGVGLVLVAWGAALAKAVAAVLPLAVFHDLGRPRLSRNLRVLAWIEAGVLTTYGLVLTAAGLLVQSGVVDSTGGDQRALAWHAYLWDPWFLVWGGLVAAALLLSRDRDRRSVPRQSADPRPVSRGS